MKKIVIDARIISSSTGRYIERILTHLEKIDKENEYVVLVRKKDVKYWKPTNKNFSVVVAEYKNFSLGEQFGFAIFLYKLKADLVHFCMPQQPILYFKPSITTMHDLILLKTYNSDKNWFVFHLKQFVGKFVFWYVAHKSKFIITPSEFSRDEYLERYKINPGKVITTLLAADKTNAKPKKIKLPFEKFVMYVGQQSDYKNVRRLILAHQATLSTNPDLGLVLVGSLNQSAQNNQEWANKHGYKNIQFTGFVSDSELAWLYQNTAVYVFPSLMEGFGLPALEAMLYGAPVVSSNATCLPEVCGDAALYFNPYDINEISEKIDMVINDESLRQNIISRGEQRVKLFDWSDTAKLTHQTYLRALENLKDV